MKITTLQEGDTLHVLPSSCAAYLACSTITEENEVLLKVYKFPDCKTNVSEKHGIYCLSNVTC